MIPRPSVIAVRRLLLAKCFAALLIALTVLPFTAPFATIDIAEVVGDRPFHSTIKNGPKTVQDPSDFNVMVPHELFPQIVTQVDALGRVVPVAQRLDRLVVLRI